MSRDDSKNRFGHIFQQVNKDSTLEFEVRFHRRFTSDERKFRSDVQPNIYYEVMENFRRNFIPNVYEMVPVKTTDTILQQQSQRLIENHCDKTESLVWKTQEQLPVFNQPSYVNSRGFKVALCKEIVSYDQQKIDAFKQLVAKQQAENVVVRSKDRTTFAQYITDNHNQKIIIFRFDFTKVSQKRFNMPVEDNYEIEMEYLGNKHPKYTDYISKRIPEISEMFLSNLEKVLKWIQNSHVLMQWEEFNDIIDRYKYLLQIPKSHTENLFRGAQPETLTRETFQQVKQQAYYVADKSDGERALLIIGPKGDCYLLSRFIQIIKLDCQIASLAGSIFDSEWFENERMCLIFDLLTYQGKDHRNDSTTSRLEKLKSMKHIPHVQNNYRIALKDIYYFAPGTYDSNIIKKILENTSHSIDGVIFTPATEPYPLRQKWVHLYKWKELNSIDLYIETTPLTDEWKLYVRTLEVLDLKTKRKGWMLKENRDTMLVRYQDSLQEIVLQKEFLDVQRSITVKMPFFPHPTIPFKALTTKPTMELMLDKHIIEFIWDSVAREMVPIKIRQDKSILGIEGSNFWTVANETWKTMINPITKEELLQNSQPKQSQRGNGSTSGTSGNGSTSGTSGTKGIKHSRPEQTKDTGTVAVAVADTVKPEKKKIKTNPSPSPSVNNRDRRRDINDSLFKFHNVIKRNLISSVCNQKEQIAIHKLLQPLGGVFMPENESWSLPNNQDVSNILKTLEGRSVVDEKTGRRIVKLPTFITKTKTANELLDLCTGKGGDIHKWCQNNLKFVLAIDNDLSLLNSVEDCALSRWSSTHTKTPDTKILFSQIDARTPVVQYLIHKNLMTDFDIVSCFFAMHYLFASPETLHLFMNNVQQNLKFNGYFIGCIMDGSRLDAILEKNNGYVNVKDSSGNQIFEVARKHTVDQTTPFKDRYPFGQEIDVKIGDSIISEYIDNIADKKEYLVNFDRFVEMAKHYDLELVTTNTFDHWYQSEKPILTEEQKTLSFMCRSFVFRKISNSWIQQKNCKATDAALYKQVTELQKEQISSQIVEHFDMNTLFSQTETQSVINEKKGALGEVITMKIDKEKYQTTMDHLKHIKRQKILYYSKDAWNDLIKNTKID